MTEQNKDGAKCGCAVLDILRERVGAGYNLVGAGLKKQSSTDLYPRP